MKKKVLCIALALLMCMAAAAPTFADNSSETTPVRAAITATYALKHVSGSTYRMYAIINNPERVVVNVALILYDASHSSIASIGKSSSNILFSMSKEVSLSPGTYYLYLVYTADYSTHAFEKQYNI